jgi:hypothetical protein
MSRGIDESEVLPEIVANLNERLNKLPMIQVHQVLQDAGDQYSVLFKVLDQKAWNRVVGEMLRVEEVLGEESPFVLHVCRQYVRYEGQLRYVPHMTVQGPKSLAVALEGLTDLLDELAIETAAEPPPKPKPKKSKPQPKAKAPEVPPADSMDAQVITVPLVRSDASRNQPSAGLWQKGSRGAHLIRRTS